MSELQQLVMKLAETKGSGVEFIDLGSACDMVELDTSGGRKSSFRVDICDRVDDWICKFVEEQVEERGWGWALGFVPDASYAAMISVGRKEHFEEGSSKVVAMVNNSNSFVFISFEFISSIPNNLLFRDRHTRLIPINGHSP